MNRNLQQICLLYSTENVEVKSHDEKNKLAIFTSKQHNPKPEPRGTTTTIRNSEK